MAGKRPLSQALVSFDLICAYVSSRAVPNILFVFYSVRIVGRIVYHIRLNSCANNTPNTNNSHRVAADLLLQHKASKANSTISQTF